MPLILVQNEVTVDSKYEHWQDDEGVQYHFPNKYIRKIKEGEQFIYYRGSRRKNNKRETPEYFGCGTIGKIWLDPMTDINARKENWHWYCEIVDYIPFKIPIPFKIDEVYFETLTNTERRNGVRNVSVQLFLSILEHASVDTVNSEILLTPASPILPKLEDVKPILVQDHSLLIRAQPILNQSLGKGNYISSTPRHSKHSKVFGDHCEGIVYNILTQERMYNLRWMAKEKQKPGWDIEYYDKENLIAVEVKGTSGKQFLNIEITSGEWKAARDRGPHYKIYLVADCLSNRPKVQIIENPYDLYMNNKISVDPLLYRLVLRN